MSGPSDDSVRDGAPEVREAPAEEAPPADEPDVTEDAGRTTARKPAGLRDWLEWLWRTDRGPIAVGREFALSILVVLVIAMLLFAISGVWPPLVAVESDSMEPQIMTGDLVFIVGPDRYVSAGAVDGTGVVPTDRGNEIGHQSFGQSGSVIIFAPNGNEHATPIIHRAHLWVEEGEDWYDRADQRLLGDASDCAALSNCPAPHDGFITHGDNNPSYDQVDQRSEPVKPEWVIARAQIRLPLVGHIRLIVSEWLGVAGPAPLAWA